MSAQVFRTTIFLALGLIGLLSALISAQVQAIELNQRYEINQSIDIMNASNQSELRIDPDHEFQFEITGERGWAYEITVYRDGTALPETYLTARSNVNAAFVLPQVVDRLEELNQAVSDMGAPRLDHCPGDAHCDEETASDAESPSPAGNYPQECLVAGTDRQWRENCAALFDSDIPEDALSYALQVMKNNASSFETSECYEMDDPNHYSMRGVTRDDFEQRMENGLPNKCQFIINDTRERYNGQRRPDGRDGTATENRGNLFYVDLCQGDSPEIHHDYFNFGTGTNTGGWRQNWRNECGQRNTLMGAFFTNYESFSFAQNNQRYRQVAARVERACRERGESGCSARKSSVQLFGLQNTNNSAARCKKYMHVSPYQSSWGCPSLRAENYWMIETLAENGPSLVLHYHDDIEPLERCER